MKRILTGVLVLSALVFSLTSCKVNWFGETRDVEWWVVAVPVTVLVIAVLVIAKISLSGKKFVCPECKKPFTPKWWQTLFTVHIGSDRVLKCPHCGRKGFCKVYKED